MIRRDNMRQWFLSSLLISCAVVDFQCLPVIEAFRMAHCGDLGARRKFPTFIPAGLITHSPPFVASGTTRTRTRLFDKQDNNDDNTSDQASETEEQVEVGTKEYYNGFLSSPIQDETVAERGSGLEQALKLGGGVILVLIALVAGFMASNGLL